MKFSHKKFTKFLIGATKMGIKITELRRVQMSLHKLFRNVIFIMLAAPVLFSSESSQKISKENATKEYGILILPSREVSEKSANINK